MKPTLNTHWRTDAEAPIFWPWGWQRMKWLDGINGHESEQTPGDGEGQGSLVCCSSCLTLLRVRHNWWSTTWERLRAEGEGGDRGWDGWMASLTQGTWVWANFQEIVKDRETWCVAIHRVAKSGTGLSDEQWQQYMWGERRFFCRCFVFVHVC